MTQEKRRVIAELIRLRNDAQDRANEMRSDGVDPPPSWWDGLARGYDSALTVVDREIK